jgi:hypothetical protein
VETIWAMEDWCSDWHLGVGCHQQPKWGARWQLRSRNDRAFS